MQLPHFPRRRLASAAATACAAALIPAAASAATAGLPASAARPAHLVTAHVANSGSDTVTPITTTTNTAGKAIRVGKLPVAIAITP
jgi:YVTN family beta-propeller protein